MKTLTHSLAILIASLALVAPAPAAITAINTPVTSTASIIFDDLFSSAPPSGITSGGPLVTPWNGSLVSLPLTTDPNTLDFASGNLAATFIPASNIYTLSFTGITLNQIVGNTGTAHLTFAFSVEYQLDALGLPLQPTLFPSFLVNGTVQSAPGSFAALSGFINYSGVNTAGTYSVLETVNYNSLWNTPGNFTATALGTPVNGVTPLLLGNTTLTIDGNITFQVDPASINASSFMQTIPQPASLVPLLALALPLRSARPRRLP